MNNQFTKQMEDKFMQEVNNVNIDSQMDDDDGYYQAERLRLRQEMNQIRNRKNQDILLEVKKNIALEVNLMKQFENQMSEVFLINQDTNSQVLPSETVKAIKQKVAAQQNISTYLLADQSIPIINNPIPDNIPKFKKQSTDLQRKLQKAAIDRETIAMEREDQLSMKYQIERLSQSFNQRFTQPNIKPKYQKDAKISILRTNPISSFTNLRPMPFTQYNVLPKNSPQIALRNIKKNKQLTLKSISIKQKNVTLTQVKENMGKLETKQQCQQNKKQVTEGKFLDDILIEYLRKTKTIFQSIQTLCKSYKPKFITKFLDLEGKAPNFDLSNNSQQKQKNISQIHQELENAIDFKKLKELKITFEGLTHLKGIQKYINIQTAALQYNLIKQIKQIKSCQHLIELNLSHNNLKDITSINQLKWLRFINLQSNKIQNIHLNNQCLEIAMLNNNLITKITKLGRNLRVLKINNNKLQKIQGLDQSYLVEEIQLKKNKIKYIDGISQCILLRKLDLSENKVQASTSSSLVYLFLNELYLNRNCLSQLPLMFLPSLEKLYLQQNSLHQYSKNIIYLPNLKILNLDQNKLDGFSFVWSMLLYSKNIQIIKYDDNQCFLILRQKVRQLYEYIIYKNMQSLKILNQNGSNIGLKKYYQSAYKIYLNKNSMFYEKSYVLHHLQRKIEFILKDHQAISFIQANRKTFSQTKLFLNYKSVEMTRNLFQIRQFIEKKIENSLFSIKDSVFYRNDIFQHNFKRSLHKIHTMIIKYLYRRRKRIKYFQKNQLKINKSWLRVHQISQSYNLRKYFNQIRIFTMKLSFQQAAIKIQKVWKGYKMRKKYLKILAKLKQKNDEDYLMEMEQIDLSQFDNIKKYTFDFDIPDNLNFEQYIIKPQVFGMLQKRNNKQQQKKKSQNKIDIKNTNNLKVNNFIQPIVENQKKQTQDEDDQRLMKEWGFKNKETLEAFKIKRRKKEQIKRKQHEKNMTAGQRYQRFKGTYKH